MISIEDIKKSTNHVWYLKFVKVDGSYRFDEILSDHRTMINSGEIVQSAGIIKAYPMTKTWEYEGWSSSLQIAMDETDVEGISNTLGMKFT